MRLGETSTLFRNEDSGEMHGLIRVRQFTISEGHLILRPEQLEDEFRGCLELAKYLLDTVGMLEHCTFRFSQWDPNNTEKYIGTPEQWDEAQSTMAKILDDLNVEYTIGIDEAAFYGPKLDIQYQKRLRQGGHHRHHPGRPAASGAVWHGVHRLRRSEEDAVYHPPHQPWAAMSAPWPI